MGRLLTVAIQLAAEGLIDETKLSDVVQAAEA